MWGEATFAVKMSAQPDRHPSFQPRLQSSWEAFVSAARREVDASRGRSPRLYPHFGQHGRWTLLPVDAQSSWAGDRYQHGNWTAGFWFGVAWLLALEAGEEEAARFAAERLELLAPRAEDSTTHDLGFLFFPSFVFGYEAGFLSADATDPAFRAARMLARRFNAQGEYIQAFGVIGDPRFAGTCTIDTMMNLPLLWWAAENHADPFVADVARRHARTSARLFVRPDGSTYHLIRFDQTSGAVASRGTFQGATEQSCWSRGQAWGACGFAWAFAATGEPEFLEAAEVSASYFFDRLGEDAIAPWDFSDRSAEAERDSSASVIAALGANILGQVHPDPEAGRRFRTLAAETLLKVAEACLNVDSEREGILLHSCYSKPDGLGIDGSSGWGDFFLGLALALGQGIIPLRVALGLSPTGGREAETGREEGSRAWTR